MMMSKFRKYYYIEDKSNNEIYKYNKLTRVAIRIIWFFLISIIALNYSDIRFSFAESTLVEGNIDSLIALTYTDYFDNCPAIFFSEQQEKEGIRILLSKVDNFVFKDSAWQDLAVEMAAQSIANGPQSKVNVKEKGIYEVYLDVSEIKGEEIPEFRIEVDGKEILQYLVVVSRIEQGRRYIKVGEVEVEAGKHEVEVIRLSGDRVIREKEVKLVLVNKEEREKAERLIWQKISEPETEVAYIFSRDGEFYVP